MYFALSSPLAPTTQKQVPLPISTPQQFNNSSGFSVFPLAIHSLLKQIGSEEVLVVLPQLDLLLSRSFITSQILLESNWTREGPDCFAPTWVAFRVIMGTEEDGQSNDNRKRNDATEKSKKGNTKRGTTIMIELNKKWDGNKIRVVYDEKGRPNNRVVRRKLAEPLRDDLWEAMQKEEFGSSREHDDRSVKWLRARQKKNGEFVNDATMEIAERIVEDGDTLSKMLPNLEISTPKEGDGDFDAFEKARNYKKSRKQVKDAGILKMKKTPTNHEFSTPKEKEETLDEMERSIREYGDMLDNMMESFDNIAIPIERELFGGRD
ncbi:hypothetical protein IFM89_006524 [Coptis chinensis]|uniref:Transposase n=1 Tax=Coptis chinensis TaxID=261450 RepID=A0A835IN90_9MAGN|nr:hypothetical protein IFM89_006524 [Coptis chinensis]